MANAAPGSESLIMVAAAPLFSAILTAAVGPRFLKKHSHWPTLIALGYAFLMALTFLTARSGGAVATQVYDWVSIGNLNVGVALAADQLTAVMLCTVTFVSFLVAIFSVGYLHGDPGYPRYFALISLFVFCMVMLVCAGNFVLLYVFWEGVGLCSYLLIGFWFEKPSAAAAALKAFLVNRVGDFGLLIGLLLIWTTFGTFEMDAVFSRAERALPAQAAAWPIAAICLLLMLGAMGKSAQFPLHVWLPDAMEGPTPVSALIHAATMVTAGVYLVARCTPLFVLAPEVQLLLAGIGGLTALLGGLIAVAQTDLKRIMAYSTISQLGLMFVALGAAAAGPAYAAFAVTAAIFHLFTHAFFKALLFLASGSVMHAMGGVIDLRRFGGLRKLMPWTHWTFLIGAAGLAALPPLAGFWSKDEILVALRAAGHGQYAAGFFRALTWVIMACAFLTAYYAARAYFLAFWGPERVPEEAGHHAHESGWIMIVPLVVLAGGTLLVGMVYGPPTHLLIDYLAPIFRSLPHTHETGTNLDLMVQSIVVAAAGVLLAGLFHLAQPAWPAWFAQRFRGPYEWSLHKFYVDQFLEALVVRPLRGLAAACRYVDQHVLDGMVDLVGRAPALGALLLRPAQNGLLQFYALASLLGLAVLVLALLLRSYGQ
jgi:NADH-quinone oxidoreductase subunit L